MVSIRRVVIISAMKTTKTHGEFYHVIVGVVRWQVALIYDNALLKGQIVLFLV